MPVPAVVGVDVGTASSKGVLVGRDGSLLAVWNPPVGLVRPRPELSSSYDELYHLYRELYRASAPVVHALSARQLRSTP